ncbi:MAG: RagB/SusD family nutrient uptake outer membrane protein [Gemmatimonadaceae bacterium]|nr:RagB/SusD family nutrient uptake outer membrane protein [Gemmatimonadaceae bacterium]
MRPNTSTARPRNTRGMRLTRLAATLGVALLATATSACDKLLSVENPGRVPVDALLEPALMPALHAAALQSFQCAFTQWVSTAGMLAGEYWSANGFVNNHIWEWRGVQEIRNEPGTCAAARGSTNMGFYAPMQRARFELDDSHERISTFTDAQVANRARLLAELRAYAGYTYVILAESMCEMTVNNGPRLTKAEVLALAESRFTDAIAAAGTANDASIRNMAYVGRARTRLDAANLTGAAADAALVTAGFVRTAEYSETIPQRENRLYNLSVRNDFVSVAPAYRGLTLENGNPDPRVRVNNMNRVGPDNNTAVWQQQKFTGSGAVALPIASYAEAQLILAEASTGQAQLDAINRVRALSNIPALVPAPGADMNAVVLEERRRQLFSEGHRYVDMLRKNLPFQSGVNRKGQSYSTLTCIPLPNVEIQNNPNFKTG